jgi:hypothetical protein
MAGTLARRTAVTAVGRFRREGVALAVAQQADVQEQAAGERDQPQAGPQEDAPGFDQAGAEGDRHRADEGQAEERQAQHHDGARRLGTAGHVHAAALPGARDVPPDRGGAVAFPAEVLQVLLDEHARCPLRRTRRGVWIRRLPRPVIDGLATAAARAPRLAGAVRVKARGAPRASL